MQLDRVREALHQRPFRPFLLKMVDGTSYTIRHPDFVALPPPPKKREIVFFGEAGVHLIDLGLIQELVLAEELQATPPPAAQGNGDQPPSQDQPT
ncbi:MAG TPA: hypothetical protein VFF52_15385 [Isosphaeraceae bacterium]|nr:hypothetical protein [Isosphaeraceae bacterium]